MKLGAAKIEVHTTAQGWWGQLRDGGDSSGMVMTVHEARFLERGSGFVFLGIREVTRGTLQELLRSKAKGRSGRLEVP